MAQANLVAPIVPAAPWASAPRSFARRAGEAAALVGTWMVLGLTLHLGPEAYLVLGIPLALLFHRFVARVPLRAAWVRSAPPLRFDVRTVGVALAFAVAPAATLFHVGRAGNIARLLWVIAGIAGAGGVGYAARNVPRARVVRYALGALLSALPGVVLFVMAAVALHVGRHTPWVATGTALRTFALSFVQYVPVCFALEEVVFRGVLDAYVAPTERGSASALLVSALWGIWHLPIVMGHGRLLTTAVSLVVVHVLIGLGLTRAWRDSGTLLVPAVAHALMDAVRNALLGG